MHGKPTRSTAADQPALLPDYKTTWFWEKVFGGFGGGMISTCAQLLQTSQLVFRNTKQHGSGGWGLGGHGKHTRSTAADQPALLPDYKIAWFCGGGGGGLGGGHDNELPHPSKFISFWGWGVGWGNQPSL